MKTTSEREESYEIVCDSVKAKVKIFDKEDEFVPVYEMKLPAFSEATMSIMDDIRNELITVVPVKVQEMLDPREMESVKKKFFSKAVELVDREFSAANNEIKKTLVGSLMHEMLGLGKLEMLINDPNLEEIVINSSMDSVWVYHKRHGWLKTNILVNRELDIQNYASSIGRKIGREITLLNPLMDAHLLTGDRVNATLFPISTNGNTITIRKFSRSPWTITDFIKSGAITPEVAALLWLAIQYELNIIVSGGTGSGKTSMLNVLMPFIQPNQRIISIEDTREIQLPSFLHWVPLTTREPNPEGKGEVSMLDLMVNSLRMRPDRIIVGEIRRAKEAEVLFEAMHTGHSVYSTFHAETDKQTFKRLTNPPVNIPVTLMDSLHLILVMYRDRRKNIRRVFQVSEIVPGIETMEADVNMLYRYDPIKDKLSEYEKSIRLKSQLTLHTGMSENELAEDLKGKVKVLEWMAKNEINTIDSVGKVVSKYYKSPENFLKRISRENPESILGGGYSKK